MLPIKRSYRWNSFKWDKTLMLPLSVTGSEEQYQSQKLVLKSLEEHVFSESNTESTIEMHGMSGKVTDCGEDRIAATYIQLPAHLDFMIEAEVTVTQFVSKPGPTNRESFGIFIRDTVEADFGTGLYFSNMIAIGGYYGRYNFFGRSGISSDDSISIDNIYLYKQVNREGSYFQSQPMHYAVTQSHPQRLRMLIAKRGCFISVKMINMQGDDILNNIYNGGIQELAQNGKVISKTGWYCVHMPQAFEQRDRKSLYIGFFAAEASLVIHKNAFVLRKLTKRDNKALPALSKDDFIIDHAKDDPGVNEPNNHHDAAKECHDNPTCTPMTIWASPDGLTNGDGTRSTPYDIQTAIKQCPNNGTVALLPGEYRLNESLVIKKEFSGCENARKRLLGECESDRTIINFGDSHNSLDLLGDYWSIENIDITAGFGLRIEGSYNNVLNCRAYKNLETGFLIRHHDIESPRSIWPSHNVIENCISFCNKDDSECNADGFACKIAAGEGNSFKGCIAFLNSDDGFDLFTKYKPIGSVTIENCTSSLNGYKLNNDGKLEATAGNGNGFKLGGTGLAINHIVVNCNARGNKTNGFTSNSNPYIHLEKCSSSNNKCHNLYHYFYAYEKYASSHSKVLSECVFDDDEQFDKYTYLEELHRLSESLRKR